MKDHSQKNIQRIVSKAGHGIDPKKILKYEKNFFKKSFSHKIILKIMSMGVHGRVIVKDRFTCLSTHHYLRQQKISIPSYAFNFN